VTAIEEELLKLHDEKGALVADDVLERATSLTNPLHAYFEWDDTVAGHEYRLVQARQLIRRVRIEVPAKRHPDRTEHLRAYVKVPGASWRHIDDVANDPVTVKLVLNQMRRDWLNMKKKYEDYAEFWGMVIEDPDVNDRAAAVTDR